MIKSYEDMMKYLEEKHEEPRRKVADYVCEQLGKESRFESGDHLRRMMDVITGKTNSYKNELYQINVDGVADYDLAETAKDNLPVMLEICKKHLDNLEKNGIEPAPFYFERAAILARKAGYYQLEVDICETYLQYMEWYIEAHEKHGLELFTNPRGARYIKIRDRLPKAKLLLEKNGKK